MRKLFANILCLFVPSKKLRHKIKLKIYIERMRFSKNKICIYDECGETVLDKNRIKNLRIEISDGARNNTIRIHKSAIFGPSKILVRGTNCFIQIGRISCWSNKNGITITTDRNGSFLTIADDTSFTGQALFFLDEYSHVEIGQDCMISSPITFNASDNHTITIKDTNTVINTPRGIFIGNHCWIGRNVMIAKNLRIGDGSIIGMSTVAAGNFTESNIIIAGNPARIIKRNIHWDRCSISQYVQQTISREPHDKT